MKLWQVQAQVISELPNDDKRTSSTAGAPTFYVEASTSSQAAARARLVLKAVHTYGKIKVRTSGTVIALVGADTDTTDPATYYSWNDADGV